MNTMSPLLNLKKGLINTSVVLTFLFCCFIEAVPFEVDSLKLCLSLRMDVKNDAEGVIRPILNNYLSAATSEPSSSAQKRWSRVAVSFRVANAIERAATRLDKARDDGDNSYCGSGKLAREDARIWEDGKEPTSRDAETAMTQYNNAYYERLAREWEEEQAALERKKLSKE